MNIKICRQGGKEYPVKLLELSKTPKEIYYIGDIKLLEENLIAVIGKREANMQSLQLAEYIGAELAKQNYTILNGLAIGCDTKAIEGALSKSGKVVAVMPGGVDAIYPKSNVELVNRIVENGGCIISEYPCGTKSQKYTFLERDRIQAALADKVIVIDSEIKSGTMYTAQCALKLNKDVGCMVEEGGNAPEGNRYLCDSKKSIALKNIQDVLDFVNKPIACQISLF